MIPTVIEALLARQIGLDVGVGRATRDRAAIATRMAALGVREPDAYVAILLAAAPTRWPR